MRSIFGGGQNRQRTQAQPSTRAQPAEAPSPVRRPLPAYQRRPLPPRLSSYSTPAVQTCGWSSLDFMLGAGMVIIQPSTQKIVVVYDTEKKYWFLPRGRKDTGESLEQAALREAYEEVSSSSGSSDKNSETLFIIRLVIKSSSCPFISQRINLPLRRSVPIEMN